MEIEEIQVFSDRDKFRYRLGDLVIHGNRAGNQILKTPDYRDTIGYRYVVKVVELGRALNRLELDRLVEEHLKKNQHYKTPKHDELVVHLRLGDRDTMLLQENIDKLVTKSLEVMSKEGLHSVTIVTAVHFAYWSKPEDIGDKPLQSKGAIRRIVERFEESGVQCGIRSAEDVDEDFCYLIKAKNLIITSGNFSILAGILNRNNVYSPISGGNRLKKEKNKSEDAPIGRVISYDCWKSILGKEQAIS